MKSHASQSNLRKKVELMYRKYRVIMIFATAITETERRKIDRNLEVLPTMTRRKILLRLPELKNILEDLTERYGFKGNFRQMENLIDGKSTISGETNLLLTKSYIQKELFDHYEQSLPIFSDLPAHARIGIDVFGFRKQRGKVEFVLLEASLFEDVAALWNNILETSKLLKNTNNDKPEIIKRMTALKRATAKAVFNLIEGYLNGIALDILLIHDTTPAEKIKLSEWDVEDSRPRPLSLRDKLLQYPKIAIQAKHPPLDESNCQEMAKILELEQRIRHSLIHPKPEPEVEHGCSAYRIREMVYIQLSIDEVAELCDLSIDLIKQISKTIGVEFGNVDLWIYKRDKSGRFPEEAFV
ncbi:MAG: hypothetical protein LUQ65_03585 [Candidatus Helarchaeota archaeon]|nr:hypothetical protein [Candidatus Helarchaeota archaeon]